MIGKSCGTIGIESGSKNESSLLHYGKIITSLFVRLVLECSDWVEHVARYLYPEAACYVFMWCTKPVKQANCNVSVALAARLWILEKGTKLRTPEMKFTSPPKREKSCPWRCICTQTGVCEWIACEYLMPLTWWTLNWCSKSSAPPTWSNIDYSVTLSMQFGSRLEWFSLTSPTVSPANQSGTKWYNTKPSHHCIWKYLWWNWGGMLSIRAKIAGMWSCSVSAWLDVNGTTLIQFGWLKKVCLRVIMLSDRTGGQSEWSNGVHSKWEFEFPLLSVLSL